MFERRDTSTAGAPKPGRRAAERTLTAFDSHQLLAPIFLVAVAAAAYLGWRLRVELIVLFGAGLFGIALYKLSRWFTKRSGLPHGVSITIWFLAGISVAVGFGVIAGLFSFVPILGPIASVVPAGLVALQSTPDKVVWVLALYAVVQFVETNLITPNVQQRMASVPPVLLISGQVILGVLAESPGSCSPRPWCWPS